MAEIARSSIPATEPLENYVRLNLATPGGWAPLSKIARAVAIKSYNPTVEQQQKYDLAKFNLGDELFMFEVHQSMRWARAYVVSAPKAEAAFLQMGQRNERTATSPLSALDINLTVAIIPLNYGLIKEYFDLATSGTTIKSKDVQSSAGLIDGNHKSVIKAGFRYSDVTTSESIDFESDVQFSNGLEQNNVGIIAKPAVPAVPYLRLGNEVSTKDDEPLVDDITSVVREWFFTYLYHNYIEGKYTVVTTIAESIKDLYFIRRKLLFGLLTQAEKVLARRRAIWQMARVTKLLQRGIVVRDPNTGAIVGLEQGAVRLAQEQFMLALAPNYPNHAVVSDKLVIRNLPKHIMVDFKSVVGQVGAKKLYVHMYLRTKTHQLTESFMIAIKTDTHLADLSAVLFRDLPVSVIKDDVFLVAAVYEEVALKSSSSSAINNYTDGSNSRVGPGAAQPLPLTNNQTPAKRYAKRGIAAGAADVSRLFRMEEMVEAPFTLRMYTNYFAPDEPSNENRGWGELIDRIIRGRPKGVAVTPRAEQVVCVVKEFEAANMNAIQSFLEQDHGRAIGTANSLFINSLSGSRNDVYVHLGRITLNHPNASRNKDLLVVSGTSTSGKALFYASSNSKGHSSWDSLAAYNDEVIGDMIRIVDFTKSEIVDLKLYIGGHFYAKGSFSIWQGSRVFSGKKTVNFMREDSNSPVATLQILIDFIGNGFNTDVAVEKILHWKAVYETKNVGELSATLRKFKVVEEGEFLKHFHDIMDCLLDMLCYFINSGNDELLLQIFDALVITLEKATARSNNHDFLADDYLSGRFNFGGLSEVILMLFERKLLNDSAENRHDLVSLFKVSEYIARLANTSGKIDFDRNEDSRLYISVTCAKFLKRITEALKEIAAIPDSDSSGVQVALCNNVFKFYSNLTLFAADEVPQLLIEVVESINTNSDKQLTAKLLLIRQISLSSFFQNPKFRSHIAAYTIKWTLPCWLDNTEFTIQRKEQLRILAGIFATQFNTLWAVRDQEMDTCKRYVQLLPLGAKLFIRLLDEFEKNKKLSNTVFSPLFPESYPFESRAVDSVVNKSIFDEVLIELGIVFTLLVNIANFSGEQLPDNNITKQQFTELAFNIVRACTAMLDCVAFPRMWVSLVGAQHETVYGCLEYLSTLMTNKFIPPPDQADEFNSELWYSYLQCILRLSGSELMSIEKLAQQKRTAIWKLTQDLRGRAAILFKRMWDAIGWTVHDEDRLRFGIEVYGGYQVQLYGGETSLVPDIMGLCLSRHRTTQKVAVNILYSMIIGEWTLNSDFTGLQKEIVISLDDIFQSRAFIPEHYEKQMFMTTLRESIKFDSEDEAFSSVMKLVNDIDEFLDLLIDLYTIPPGDAYNDDRIFHALNVLNFLKDIDRVEIFSRYVYDIAEWNKLKSNFVQTGLSYRLLASAFEWSYSIQVPPSKTMKLPAQSSFERKVALYEKAISFFTRGRAFENAIEATKELMTAYETVAYDFKQLVGYSTILGKLYADVDNVERLTPQYFRVMYIGSGFPRSLRDRQFIMEGTPWEKLEGFHERLNKLYPSAVIVNSEALASENGQYLYVSSVVPETNQNSLLGLPNCSPGAREYHTRLDLRYFSYSKPIGTSSSALDLWVEKTVYETYQAFPTIVKRSEVKQVSTIKLSPLQNALETLDGKINDLVALEAQFGAGRANQGTVSKLNLVLSGAIDSPINGGVQIYRAFLEDDNLKTDPQQAPLVQVLDAAFLDYAFALERCLNIHGKVVPSSLKPLHNSLTQLFERNYAPELAILAAERDGKDYGSLATPPSTASSGMSATSGMPITRRVSSYDISRISISNGTINNTKTVSDGNGVPTAITTGGLSGNSTSATTNHIGVNGFSNGYSIAGARSPSAQFNRSKSIVGHRAESIAHKRSDSRDTATTSTSNNSFKRNVESPVSPARVFTVPI